jgi:membrane associated rhomboid family serine protease
MAFRHPGGDAQRVAGFWRLTTAIKWLLIANAAIYVVELVTFNWLGMDAMILHLSLTPSRVVPGLELWQPLTYMWMHDPRMPSHILLNMFGLWMFGTMLEQRWGALGFLKFYVATGAIAGLVVLVTGWIFGAEDTMTLGASGAVYAVVVGFGLLFPDLRIYLLGILPMKAKWLVWLVIGGTAVSYLARAPGISVAAHAGGMAAGALLLTGWWNPLNVVRSVRRLLLRRRLRVVERDLHGPHDDDRGPMIH